MLRPEGQVLGMALGLLVFKVEVDIPSHGNMNPDSSEPRPPHVTTSKVPCPTPAVCSLDEEAHSLQLEPINNQPWFDQSPHQPPAGYCTVLDRPDPRLGPSPSLGMS